MPKTSVVVGLGSNKVALRNLRLALAELRQFPDCELLKISSIYESEAQVLPNSPKEWHQKYLNAAVLMEVNYFNPEMFLFKLKNIEKKLGRSDATKWAPREIDLDILYVEGFSLQSELLNIPHKNLCDRPFALLPTLEVLPNFSLQRPAWSYGWLVEKPFNTKKSKQFFWPELVGVLNITTDSFSDGGKHLSEDSVKAKIIELANYGVSILDFGAESTRPEAAEISEDFEYQKLVQALRWFNELNLNLKISIDSRHAKVIEKLQTQFELCYINDVTGFSDDHMLELLKSTNQKAVVMHSLSIPPNQTLTLNKNENPCVQLVQWWFKKLEVFEKNNIDLSRLIFDPGIGFGKTPEQNSYILNHLEELAEIKSEIFLGFSRKSFLKQFTDVDPAVRDLATAVQLTKINQIYCQYLRVHDAQGAQTTLRMLP